MVDDELSEGVVAFLGPAGLLNPIEPEDRVRALLGDRAFDVVPRIQAMLTDLHAATPPLWDTGDLQEMGRNVVHWLRENHPELN